MSEQRPGTVGDLVPHERTLTAIDLSEAERRYDAHLERKHRAYDRLITGGLIINAASTTAVFAAIQAGQTGLDKLGITVERCATSLGFFAMGAIASAFAHWTESITTPRWAADQYERLALLRRKQSIIDLPDVPKFHRDLQQVTEELRQHPPSDFRFNHPTSALVHASGSFWMVGIGTAAWPLWRGPFAEIADTIVRSLKLVGTMSGL